MNFQYFLNSKHLSMLFFVVIAASACLPSNSAVKIFNGANVDQFYPAVIKIMSAESQNTQSFGACTGTMVSPNVMITAAHCLTTPEGLCPKEPVVWVVHPETGEKIYADINKVFIHEKYPANCRVQTEGNFDVAIVAFDQTIATNFVSLKQDSAKVSDPAVIIGFGDTQLGAANGGAKTSGRVTIDGINGKRVNGNSLSAQDTVETNYVKLDVLQNSSGEAGVNLQGDSGGPMLVGNFLVGVASTHGYKYNFDNNSNFEDRSVLGGTYLNLNAPSSRSWMQQVASQNNLEIYGLTKEAQDIDVRNPGIGGQSTDSVVPPTGTSGALNNLALHVRANGAGGYTADFILPSTVNQTDIKVCKADKVAGCTTVQFPLMEIQGTSLANKQYRISGVALNESVVIVATDAHSRGFKLTN